MTFEQHAATARVAARAAGAADCIHYADNRNARADALYAVANRAHAEHGLKWRENGGGNPYLLADGRMVVVSALVWFVELPHEVPRCAR